MDAYGNEKKHNTKIQLKKIKVTIQTGSTYNEVVKDRNGFIVINKNYVKKETNI